MQNYFHELAGVLDTLLHGDEVYTAAFRAEDSDFVRFSHSAVRQAGHVLKRTLSVDLINGRRHAAQDVTISGQLDADRARLRTAVEHLRALYAILPEDPYLLYATDVQSTTQAGESNLPEAAAAVADIRTAGAGSDLVGIYASGGIYAGFANALGQRNWFASHSYNFDWSFYHAADKAVKAAYAGFTWDGDDFARRVARTKAQLDVLRQPARTIAPGRYRVYLAPAALNELVETLGQGGFGLKAHRTKQTPLLRMISGDAQLDPRVSINENTAGGVAPNFQEAGFLRPAHVALIAEGRYRDCLVSPRSAQEYGVATNGASAAEAPQSVELAAGGLAEADVLKQLGTGIYIGNLWYLNYSDRNACRTTGMTRFGTFWVENGTLQGPLNVMRFDETLYHALGDRLVDFTQERELLLDPTTYFGRATTSAHLPGALVADFAFTL